MEGIGNTRGDMRGNIRWTYIVGYIGGAHREGNAQGNYGNTRGDKRGDIRWIVLGYTGEANREGNAREMHGKQ